MPKKEEDENNGVKSENVALASSEEKGTNDLGKETDVEEPNESVEDSAEIKVQDEIVPEEAVEEAEEIPSELEADADDLKNQLLRTLAEFENFKKRTQREIGDLIGNANERLILSLLPAIDDFERALKAAEDLQTEDERIQPVVKGFESIYEKLMKTLADYGVRPIESIGHELDVSKHDALMQVEMEGKKSHTIVEEHEKGYYLNEKVIRHAKVIVIK